MRAESSPDAWEMPAQGSPLVTDVGYHLPAEPLRPFVRSYFHVRLPQQTEFVFPSDGCPGLVVNLGRPILLGTHAGDLVEVNVCRFFGYLTRRLLIRAPAQAEVIAVKFRPGQLMRFSSVPGAELTDNSVGLADLWGSRGELYGERLASAAEPGAVMPLLDEMLLERSQMGTVMDPGMASALRDILSQRGQLRVDALAQKMGLSRRQLERRFARSIGLSPKRMCRIARLGTAIHKLRHQERRSWTELALESGFADQAHFIRDWKYFTGEPPHSYLRRLSHIESAIVGL